MNAIMRWMLVFVMVVMVVTVAAPAFAVEAVQMFKCEMEDEATEDDLRAVALEWLTAARQMKGGEKLEVYLYFPLAVNMTGDTDFLLMVHAPSVEQWGVFWDGYKGSPASMVDQGSASKAICPDSALWEAEGVELKP